MTIRRKTTIRVCAFAALATLATTAVVSTGQPIPPPGLHEVTHTSALAGKGTVASPLDLGSGCGSGSALIYDGSAWNCGASGAIYTGSDGVVIDGSNVVSVTPCAEPDQQLTWNGASWTCANVGKKVFPITAYGAVIDGVTDDGAAWRAAIAAASAAGGGIVFEPGGVSIVGRDASNEWLLKVPSNVTIQGVRGNSTLKAKAGLPNATVASIYIDTASNVAVRDMIIDGNWGNAVTTVTSASAGTALPTSIIHVGSTTNFPSSGTFTLSTHDGPQTIAYTGTTSTTFTGCSGGTGTLERDQKALYADSQTGLNQTTQADPTNHGVMIRGGKGIAIEDDQFIDIYGDGIYLNSSASDSTDPAQDVWISNTAVNLAARQGLTFGGQTKRVRIRGLYIDNAYYHQIDSEPPQEQLSDIEIEASYFGTWGNPGHGASNITATFDGGAGVGTPSNYSYERNVRVTNCTFKGPVLIQDSIGVHFNHNRVEVDWGGYAASPISLLGSLDDVWVEDNAVYDRTTYSDSSVHSGIVAAYNTAPVYGQPIGVHVDRNHVAQHAGGYGVQVDGTGGHDVSGVLLTGATGTATSTSSTSVTDSTKSWTTNQWAGFNVRIGESIGTIQSNTSTALTILAWTYKLGTPAPTPSSTGTYVIDGAGGLVTVDDNSIDLSDDGHGAGSIGIYVYGGAAGMRVRVADNNVRDSVGDAILVDSTFRQIEELYVYGNRGWDNQTTTTCTNVLDFKQTGYTVPNIAKLVLRDNLLGPGCMTRLSGLTAGYWLVDDSEPQHFAGWGVPDGVITADIGATFQRRDAGGAAALWVKENNNASAYGWVRLSQPAPKQWTVDPGSGIGIPQTPGEWAAVINAAGLSGTVTVPDAFWLMQESSGDLADSSGNGHTLTAANSGRAYAQAVSGWSTKAVFTTDNTNATWMNTDSTLPDMSSGGITIITYAVNRGASSATEVRQLVSVGTTTTAYVGGSTKLRGVEATTVASGSYDNRNAVRPFGLVHDHAGSTAAMFDDVTLLSPAFSGSVTGKGITIGANPSVLATPASYHLYTFAWFTPLSTNEIKSILTQLGWTVEWTGSGVSGGTPGAVFTTGNITGNGTYGAALNTSMAPNFTTSVTTPSLLGVSTLDSGGTPVTVGTATSSTTFANGPSGINNYAGTHLEYVDDLLDGTRVSTGTYNGWQTVTAAGAGVLNQPDTSDWGTRIGVHIYTPGTTATGRMAEATSPNLLDLSAITDVAYWSTVGVAALSTSTDEFEVVDGMMDTVTSYNQVDGCYFLYDRGNVATAPTTGAGNTSNYDKWECRCAANSVYTAYVMDGLTVSDESFTTVNAPVAATTAPNTNWQRLKVVITGTTRAEFYVDYGSGFTKSCDIDTHIPNGSARLTGAGELFMKSAGTTARYMYLDQKQFDIDISSARSP